MERNTISAIWQKSWRISACWISAKILVFHLRILSSQPKPWSGAAVQKTVLFFLNWNPKHLLKLNFSVEVSTFRHTQDVQSCSKKVEYKTLSQMSASKGSVCTDLGSPGKTKFVFEIFFFQCLPSANKKKKFRWKVKWVIFDIMLLFFFDRMKRKFYSWDECMNLREVKVRIITAKINPPSNSLRWPQPESHCITNNCS